MNYYDTSMVIHELFHPFIINANTRPSIQVLLPKSTRTDLFYKNTSEIILLIDKLISGLHSLNTLDINYWDFKGFELLYRFSESSPSPSSIYLSIKSNGSMGIKINESYLTKLEFLLLFPDHIIEKLVNATNYKFDFTVNNAATAVKVVDKKDFAYYIDTYGINLYKLLLQYLTLSKVNSLLNIMQ